MYPSQLEFIRHIIDECQYIVNATQNKTEDEIIKDETLSRALVRSLEIIGEATKQLDEDIKDRYPQIDWKDMARMRDRLIHHYFGVDYEIVCDTVFNDIPELHHELLRIIKIESRNL